MCPPAVPSLHVTNNRCQNPCKIVGSRLKPPEPFTGAAARFLAFCLSCLFSFSSCLSRYSA
jgi:hypothetical protein